MSFYFLLISKFQCLVGTFLNIAAQVSVTQKKVYPVHGQVHLARLVCQVVPTITQ